MKIEPELGKFRLDFYDIAYMSGGALRWQVNLAAISVESCFWHGFGALAPPRAPLAGLPPLGLLSGLPSLFGGTNRLDG
ncbi:MAG: hypothetical protein E8G75_07965, partial [Sulfitobacter sp. SK025]